jgi:hypothetical protein
VSKRVRDEAIGDYLGELLSKGRPIHFGEDEVVPAPNPFIVLKEEELREYADWIQARATDAEATFLNHFVKKDEKGDIIVTPEDDASRAHDLFSAWYEGEWKGVYKWFKSSDMPAAVQKGAMAGGVPGRQGVLSALWRQLEAQHRKLLMLTQAVGMAGGPKVSIASVPSTAEELRELLRKTGKGAADTLEGLMFFGALAVGVIAVGLLKK